MAKTSMLEREKKRARIVKKFANKRSALKAIIKNLDSDPVHLHDDCPVAVELGFEETLLELIPDVGDLAEGHFGAVGAREDDDVLIFGTPVDLALAAQQYFTARRLDGTARHVKRRVANGAGDLVYA